MKKFLSPIIVIGITLCIIACKDQCDYETQTYIGNSIDIVDNSGLKPISITGDNTKANIFGIYVQLDFLPPKNPDACLVSSNQVPTRFEVITLNRFDFTYHAGSIISDAFTILNSDKSYPVIMRNAKIKEHNYLLLNLTPSKDTIQQFIVKAYKDTIMIAIDTTRPILLKR